MRKWKAGSGRECRARQLRERARLGEVGGWWLGNEAEIDLVRGSTRAGKSLAGCRRAWKVWQQQRQLEEEEEKEAWVPRQGKGWPNGAKSCYSYMEQGTRQAKETEYDKQRLCHTKRKQENIKQRCKRPKQSKTRQSKRERGESERPAERESKKGTQEKEKFLLCCKWCWCCCCPPHCQGYSIASTDCVTCHCVWAGPQWEECWMYLHALKSANLCLQTA